MHWDRSGHKDLVSFLVAYALQRRAKEAAALAHEKFRRSLVAKLLSRWKAVTLCSTAGAVLYLWYYLSYAVQRPRLYFKPGWFSRQVITGCNMLLRPYYPPPFAFNTHLQTILGVVRGATCSVKYKREILAAPDGGCVALDWADVDDSLADEVPIVLVLHGLTGGSAEGYCKWVCRAVRRRGWRAVVLNYRGCAGLPLTSPRGYSAAFTDDVAMAIADIRSRYPDSPLMAVGYSLGSLILTKYIADADSAQRDDGDGGGACRSGLVAAAMVSNPFCMFSSRQTLHIPFTMPWIYNIILAYRLRQYCIEHSHRLMSVEGFSMDVVLESWTLQHMEDRILLKTMGYKDYEEYYTAASSLHHIPNIRTPSLFLVSEDDPFLGRLPYQEIQKNEWTVLATTNRGGHVAFLQGLWPLSQGWAEDVLVQYFDVMAAGAATEGAAPAAAPLQPPQLTAVASHEYKAKGALDVTS